MQTSRAGICSKVSCELIVTRSDLQTPTLNIYIRRLSLVTRHSLLVTRYGFTLLELIVVVFIISLVLGIALPSLTGVGEKAVKSEARRIGSIIRYLNDTSIATKETLVMEFNFKNKTLGYKSENEEKTEKFNTVSGVELQSKGIVSDGEIAVVFGPSGVRESIVFHLSDDKSAVEVFMNAANGRVKIVENQNEERMQN